MVLRALFVLLFPIGLWAQGTGATTRARVLTTGELEVLRGTWIGEVRYLEFDNLRRSQLPVALVITYAPRGGMRWSFIIPERNGNRLEDMSDLRGRGPGEVSFDGVWRIEALSTTPDSFQLVLRAYGRDNRRRALLRERIVVTGDSLIHQRLVRYAGSAAAFERFRYALERRD